MHPNEVRRAFDGYERRRQEREAAARRLGFLSFRAYHAQRWSLQGRTVGDLADELGVSATAIREGGKKRLGVKAATLTGSRRFRAEHLR